MIAVALAAAVLVMAAARPQRTVAVPIERASIVLATDVSGSMTATDVEPSRLVAAKRAARNFAAGAPRRINIGLVAFNQQARVLQSPTTDRLELNRAIDSMQPSGGTAAGEAILASIRSLSQRAGEGGRRPPAAIVLLSDGATTSGACGPWSARTRTRAAPALPTTRWRTGCSRSSA